MGKQKLTAFLDFINGLLDGPPRTEGEVTSGIAVAEIMRVFDDGPLAVLEFLQEENVIVIRRKQYLGRDTWLAINAKVDELNEHWISAGEDKRLESPVASM